MHPLIIEEIQKTNIDSFVIIFDSKSTSQNERAIWQVRTGRLFCTITELEIQRILRAMKMIRVK